MPGCVKPELRADDVHDALAVVVEAGEAKAELADVALERGHHVLGHHVEERPRPHLRGHDVIDGGEGAIGPRDLPAPQAQFVERLRRGDLVDQVQTDEELRLPASAAGEPCGDPTPS